MAAEVWSRCPLLVCHHTSLSPPIHTQRRGEGRDGEGEGEGGREGGEGGRGEGGIGERESELMYTHVHTHTQLHTDVHCGDKEL